MLYRFPEEKDLVSPPDGCAMPGYQQARPAILTTGASQPGKYELLWVLALLFIPPSPLVVLEILRFEKKNFKVEIEESEKKNSINRGPRTRLFLTSQGLLAKIKCSICSF
jgi:hypothetical protein